MASELLKRKSLINRLKEPDVPVINFDLINSAKDYNIESIEEDILPAPKPKELFEERDRLRIESLEQSLQDTKPFLMDESVDFIEREEFNKGSKKFRQVTDEEFIELYKEFQSLDNLGTDSEFVDFLNEKRIRPGTLGDPRLSKNKRFTTKTVSGRRQRLNLKTKVRPNVSPKKQAEVAKINELIQKEVNIANKGSKYVSPTDISFKVEDQLNMKPYFIDRINAQGKKIKIRDKRFSPNSYPALKNLDSMVTKVDNVLKEMLISEEPLNDYFYKELAKRTDLDNTTITKIRNNVPTYRVIADQGADKLLTIKNEPTLKNLSLSQQLVEAIEIEKGMPTYIDYGEGKKQVASPRANIMQFARRSWNNNKGQGEIKFFNKNGKLIKWKRGLKLPYKKVSFSYQGKKYNVNSLIPTLVQKDFPEVKKVTDAANQLRTIQIDDPFNPGKKISVNNLIRKVQVDGYKWKPKFGTINVLHGPEGVKNKPFTNLTYNTRDINQLEAGFTNSLKAGTITETQYKKIVKELYKPFVKGDLDKAIIDRVTKQAQQIKKGKFYGFEDLKTKLGQKKLTALQEIMQGGKTMGVNPELAIRAGKEEFVDPLLRTGARGLRGAATIGDFLISAGPGAKGLGLGLLLEADPIVTGMSEGKTFGQTARDTFVGSAIDAIPGVNLGSLGEDLIKLAQTEGQKMSAQNLIDYQKDYDRFLKDRNAFLSYQDLSQSELDELGFDNESLMNLERDLINRFKDIQTRAPKVYNPQNMSNITELARKAAEQRYKNLEGIQGFIFGDRMAKDPEFIDKQAQQILAAFTGVEGATDSFADSYKSLPQEQLTSDELDERFDMEGGIMAASGGRIGFAEGPMDPKRRLFMKIMGGIMSLPFVSKFVGKSDLAKPVVKLSGTTTNMPDWFPDFVNKMMFTTGGKRIDADVMEYTTPKLPGVKMLRNDEGEIIVEGKNAYGEPYEIIYRPPGYELVDETTGKAVKIPGEFKASDTQFRRTGPEIDDYDVDYETVKDVDDILGGDSTKLEGFAKGTGETKYTKGQKEIDMAEAEGTRADVDEGPDIDLSDYED